MSRAFIKEDAGDDSLPERPLPSGPNYVTARGLALLREKAQALQARRTELSAEEVRDLRYWQTRLGGAVLVDHSKNQPQDIRFGAFVEVRDAAGKTRVFHIVGQDEAAEGGDKISWDSVPARALLGHQAGDKAAWPQGESDVEMEIISIRYGA